MPSYMPHLCGKASPIHEARRNYAAGSIRPGMQDRQRPIAEWMREVMQRRGIAARAWAEKAQLGKDTVSRAIRDGYEHVTSTTTIAKLADALGERPYGAAAGVPSVASLESILAVLHQTVLGEAPMERELTRILASSLRDTLLHLADEPEALDDPRLSQTLARVAVRPHTQSSARPRKS
jgi:hypothetical protein